MSKTPIFQGRSGVRFTRLQVESFVVWITKRITEIENGAKLPDCWHGTHEECLQSAREERDEKKPWLDSLKN